MELLFVASGAALLAGCLICLGIGPRRPCDVATGAVAVTLALVVLLGKILLLLGIFRPVPVAVAATCCAAAAAGWLFISDRARARALQTLRTIRSGTRRIRFAPVGCIAVGAVLVLVGYEAAMGSRLPPASWDSLYYHLISVAEWVRTGHLVSPLPGLSRGNPVYIYFHADSFPKDDELTAAWFAVFTHNTQLVGLAQVVYAPLLFGGVYGICRHLDVRAGLAVVAAAIATFTPAVVQELATNYVDVAAAAAVLAAWQFLLSAFPATPVEEDPTAPKVRSLVLAGITFALAAGIKSTNLEYCLAGLIIAVGLCVRESRRLMRAARLAGLPEPALPRPGPCMVALAVPMIALGSFWYIRSWFVWGSPLWPIQLGPFPGAVSATQFTNVGGLQIPLPLRGDGGLLLILRSWAFPGLSLGDIWLYVLLPAIAVAIVIAVRRRRLMPVAAAVVPLFLLDMLSPGSWEPRFEIPMIGAGVVALALVCEAIATPASAAARGFVRAATRRDALASVPPPAAPVPAALLVGLLVPAGQRASLPPGSVPLPAAAASPGAVPADAAVPAGAVPAGAVPAATPALATVPPAAPAPASSAGHVRAATRAGEAGQRGGRAGRHGRPGRVSHRRPGASSRRLTSAGRRLAATGVSAVAITMAGTTAWATVNSMSDWQVAGTVRHTVRLLAEPESARQNLGPWQAFNAVNNLLTAPGAVAFFANNAPMFALPLAGMDFERAVVVLPPYQPVGIAGHSTTSSRKWLAQRLASVQRATASFGAMAAQMRRLHARYLFVPAGSLACLDLMVYTPAQLRLVSSLTEGPVFELTAEAAGQAGRQPAS